MRFIGCKAEAFVKKATEATAEEFRALRKGIDMRLPGRGFSGAAHSAGGRILHRTAFSTGD
jgi:hypothetical protein